MRKRLQCVGLALVGLSLALACTQAGRSGGSGSPATLTTADAEAALTKQAAEPPTLTPIPDLGPECPVDQFVCDAAVSALDAFESGDLAALVAVAEPIEFTCTPELVASPAEPVSPICDGREGETVQGYGYGSKTFKAFDAAQFADRLQTHYVDLIAQTAPTFDVASVGCPRVSEGADHDCGQAFAVAIDALHSTGSSTTFVLVYVVREDESMRLGAIHLPLNPERYLDGGLGNTGQPGTALPQQMWFQPWSP